MTQPIKIETLQIRNFKRVNVAEVEFKPDGVSILGGKNRQGKSTFLDAICALLGGKKYLPSNPHNIDAEGAKALARVTLNNGIEVELSGDKSTLKVKVDGKRGNMGTLKEFLNVFALDINKFMRASDTDKGKMLIEHLGIGEKLEFLDKKIDSVFNQRTVLNAEVKRKKELSEACVTFDDAPEAHIDVSALMEELKRLQAINQAATDRVERMREMREAGMEKQERAKKLREEAEALEAEVATMKSSYAQLNAEHAAFTPHDTASVESQISNASAINGRVDANAKAKLAEEEYKTSKKSAQALTDSLEEARAQRVKLISEIDMPLPELMIEEGKLVYKGQQWDNMSGAERLTVATAIARAFKPECGFVLIDELEQMDWDTIKEFDAWAVANGVQIIGAMVCDEDKAGENVIIIEDGRVKGAK